MNKKPNYQLLGIILGLVAFGILILASVSAAFSQEKYGSPYAFLSHQIMYGLIPGIISGFFAYRIPLSNLKKWAFPIVLANIALMALVFVPKIGMNFGGASRWLDFGIISFQPSELLKLTFIIYLAAWLDSRMKNRKSESHKGFGETFLPFIVVIGIVGLLLILQPDISTLGIIGLTALSIYFIANTPLWQSLLIVFAGLGGLAVLIKMAPYRVNRLLVFLKPESDPMGIGYHIKQALIAIGSGGIFGVGLGMSRQKFGFLPESIGDSIFAIFSEEMGFIGTTLLVSGFLFLTWQGFKLAKNSIDNFHKFTAFGITFWIIMQTIINIGSTTAILPLSGVPLPFVSYGGTALAIELCAMGLLLNISRQKSEKTI